MVMSQHDHNILFGCFIDLTLFQPGGGGGGGGRNPPPLRFFLNNFFHTKDEGL